MKEEAESGAAVQSVLGERWQSVFLESLFQTLKYVPAYPSQPFETLEAVRRWVFGCVRWYNDEHRHGAIRYVMPSQRHRGEDAARLKQREEVHEAAKQRNPERWSGQTQN